MRTLTHLSALITLSIICGPAQAEIPIDWDKIVNAYMQFSANAHPNNADGKALLDLLPKAAACDGQQTAIPDIMIDSKYFQYLSKEAYAGNDYAADIMFRLSELVCGDAEHSEFMDISIGGLIKPQPALFLSLLKQYDVKHLSGVLGNLGDNFVDKPGESAQELQLRYTALASVKDAPTELQQECLAELKKMIARERLNSGSPG